MHMDSQAEVVPRVGRTKGDGSMQVGRKFDRRVGIIPTDASGHRPARFMPLVVPRWRSALATQGRENGPTLWMHWA